MYVCVCVTCDRKQGRVGGGRVLEPEPAACQSDVALINLAQVRHSVVAAQRPV